MGTNDAFILVGHTHMFHGGLMPSYILSLHTNDVPYWSMRRYPATVPYEPEFIIWDLDLDHPAQEPLLMIATYILKNKEIIELLGPGILSREAQPDFHRMNKEKLEKIYETLRKIDFGDLIILYIAFKGSDVFRDLHKLKEYKATILLSIPETIAKSKSLTNPWENTRY